MVLKNSVKVSKGVIKRSKTASLRKIKVPKIEKKSDSHVVLMKSQDVKKSRKSQSKIKKEIKVEDNSFENEIDEEIEELQSKYSVNAETVSKAIQGIIKFTSENPRLKNQLFDNQIPLYLQVHSIKHPKCHSRILRIPLKNSILTPDSEICLIVPEVKGIKNKEHEKHVEHYEDLLRKKGVNCIKKIMTFHEFRTEYETFELKRRLVELYDIFLVSGNISGKVVKKCGKIFHTKRKVPTAVKLQATKLKEHIEKTLCKTPMYLHSRGDSFIVQFGHSKMPLEQLISNIFDIIKTLDEEFPGGFANLRSLNLFTYRGLAIPIYTTLRNQNDVVVHKKSLETSKKIEPVVGELSTRMDTEVKVEPTGEVTVLKKQNKGVSEEISTENKSVFVKSESQKITNKKVKLEKKVLAQNDVGKKVIGGVKRKIKKVK